MVVNDKLNLTMLCDFYELTMGSGVLCQRLYRPHHLF